MVCNKNLRQKLADLEVHQASVAALPANTRTPSDNDIRILCVLLAILAVVSFRSVPRILLVFSDKQYASIGWIPHFTSVINWTLRFGLGKIQSVGKIAEKWLAIIDTSIDVSIKKVLVVLRVKLSALSERGSAIGLQDCECIGVQVSENWNGKSIATELKYIFDIAGVPTAIIKDNGADLRLGIRLWQEESKEMQVAMVDDIGHILANALQFTYEKSFIFKQFIAAISFAGKKLRQSDISFLTPPKIRSKGRFQSIMNVASWGNKLLKLFTVKGRPIAGSLEARLHKILPNFSLFRPFLETFVKTNTIVSDTLSLLKHRGLNRLTYREAISFAEKLPPRSKVRKKLIAWLNKHIRIHCLLGIKQMPLLVSSDIIESLFGKFKILMQRNPKAEFNRIILAIPSLCGDLNEKEVHNSLMYVTHSDLEEWERKNVLTSHNRKRRKFMESLQQKTGRASTA